MSRQILRASIPFIVFLCFLSSISSTVTAESGNNHYMNGRELQTAGKYLEAAGSYEKAISKNPDHIMARYYLGLIYMRNVITYEKSEKMFLEIPSAAMRVESKPRDDILFITGLALGRLYIKNGKPDNAIQLVRSVISSASPGSPMDQAFNILGLAYYYERLYGEAIFEFRRAIKYNPGNREAKFNLKAIRARLEHFHAGKIYSRMEEREEAIKEFRKAIDLDPRFVEARFRLGIELYLQGDSIAALKELRRAESISALYRKTFEIWYAEGLALNGLGQREEAMEMFIKTIQAKPNFAAAHNEVGKILLEKGDYDAAITYFVKAIGIDPKVEYARNLQATFLKKGAQ